MADSESLFINGDSDEEKELQRSRSRSPQDRNVVNVDAPKLNAAATPFNPFVPANLGASSQNSFPSTTFGRPSSNPLTTQNPPSSTPTFNFSSKPATQEAFGNNETPKFDFLAAANAKKGEESKETPKAFSNKEPKTFNFFPSTGKTRATHNSMKSSPFGTVPEGAKGVFGQPPAASPTVKPSVPAQSPLNIPSSSVETTAPLQPKSVLDQPSASPAPPSFSFGTSPLFNLDAPKQNDKTEQVATSSALPDFEGKAPGTAITKPDDDVSKSAFFPTLTAPPGPTPILFAPTAQPAIPSISTQPEIFKASTALFPNFLTTETAPASPPSKPQETSAPLQPASFFPKPKNIETSLPQPPAISLTNQSQPPAQPKAQGPNILATSSSKAADNASTQARQGTQTPKQPQTNPRSLLLDKLSDALMLEDNGLLQQFIEFTVGPIITSSIAQLADEESWEEASQSSSYHCGFGEALLIWSRGMSSDPFTQEVF